MKSWMYLAAIPPIVVLGGIIAFWMAKHGAPQQAWLFCHVLEWC